MSKYFLKALAAVAVVMASAGGHAALLYDQNLSTNIIYGTGNPNGNFTVGSDHGIEVGLRAKERFGTNTGSNGDGSYNQPTGVSSGTRAVWNFDWSIYTGTTGALGNFTYRLGLDSDKGVGTNFVIFDPLNVAFADHSFGDASTPTNGGVEAVDAATYATLLGNSTLVQQSWNFDFFNALFPFNANDDGVYSIYLEVLRSDDVVARSDITVIVGAGAVPEPASLTLVGLALAGLAAASRRQRG